MNQMELRHFLDDSGDASSWFATWGVTDPRRAQTNLQRLAGYNIPLDLLSQVCDQLATHLPQCPDPDMALNNLERFVAVSRNPLAMFSLFERDPGALGILVQIFSTSQYFSDLLISDNESFELLRINQGRPVSREALVQELSTEVLALSSPTGVAAALRRFKRRETLRIGYGDIIRNLPLEQTTRQISYLADAIIEAALRAAYFQLEQKYGTPIGPDRRPARFCVLGLGKLGGEELNYSSDIDLMFLFDHDGQTNAQRRISNREFFERLGKDITRLLSESSDLGQAYRVDLRLRPEGQRGPLAISVEAARQYYDLVGRTWERQAFIKARPVAGALELGRDFLGWMESWIYRKYLMLADIAGIKALKRRIEVRAAQEGDQRNVKTGHGGIRDVEFVIQFLQLLNAADQPKLRTGNTLRAISTLCEAGVLTDQERRLLDENYRFLRKVEHRLQFMFDLQTHRLPECQEALTRLAARLGYETRDGRDGLDLFHKDLQTAQNLNRTILDHLLHDAFPDDPELDPEADLVLDPQPSAEKIAEVLGKYPFQDPQQTYRHLMDLAHERSRYLFPRRCRMMFATIASRLLEAVAAQPAPEQTLVGLAKVSDSLGGKVVLYELFRTNPGALKLYVDLCCYSPLLSDLLIRNPGMIDELMDSLLRNQLPNVAQMRAELYELTRAAEDPEPILHAFKNSHTLSTGVRDLLGKEAIESTTSALSDVAEVCLERIVRREYDALIERYGEPTVESETGTRPCPLIILAMGKFGGRELSYQSDLDVVFLYEAEGNTRCVRRSRKAQTTSNQHFYSELAQRIIKTASRMGPLGRLYEIDVRLRPTGRSGAPVTSLAGFARYFHEGQGQLWERQALLKSRVFTEDPALAQRVQSLITEVIYAEDWSADQASKIHEMRLRMQQTVSPENIKRGAGGIVDVEFLTQMLQLRFGGADESLRHPDTLSALAALAAAGHVSADHAHQLSENYRFLRRTEARLRLAHPTAHDELPSDPVRLNILAHGMGFPDGGALLDRIGQVTRETRARFEMLFSEASQPG